MRFIMLVGLALVLLTGTAAADIPPDQAHDLGIPEQPPGLDPGFDIRTGIVIDGVPDYNWYRGCGPTALGMVVGYWDGHGFPDLVPGDASTQTVPVCAMMSSQGNWTDYCLPMDDTGPVLPDLSEPPFGDEHPDDSVADYMKTSQSIFDLRYGWSFYNRVGPAFDDYVEQVSSIYVPSYEDRGWGSFSWAAYRAEIDAGRPVVFLVDSDADGGTDHFVTAIGYDDETQTYACRDTWSPPNVRWFSFAQMAPGQPFGIYGAILCQLDAVTAAVEHAPTALALSQNYPNPFNPRTVIAITLPAAGPVSLTIHDSAGRAIQRPLRGERLEAGRHEVVWNGRDAAGHEVGSGVYFARLEAAGERLGVKMVLLR